MAIDRKLAPSEKIMEFLNRCSGSFNVVTISRIRGKLTAEIVTQALGLIQSRHPRLNSRLVGALDSLQFELGVASIPLRVVQKHSTEQCQEVIVEELNQAIDSDKYLMRCVLIKFSDDRLNYLVTTLHHAISDGLSTIQLHSEILTYCQKIVADTMDSNMAFLEPLPDIQELFPKSMQGEIGKIKSILFLLRLKLKLSLHRPKTLKFEQCVPIESRRCGIVQRKLNAAVTTKLIALCRKQGTTVQGALCAAMLMAAGEEISKENSHRTIENLPLSCRSFVDLRQHLKPEIHRENLGILVSSITSLHHLNKDTYFWNLARDVRNQLKVSLESEDIFSVAMMFEKIFKTLISLPNQAPVTIAVTNVGKINIPNDYGLFKLEEISFVPAQAVFGGIFGAAITTFKDTMILNFMFSEPSISQARIKILVDRTITEITEACQESIVAQG